LEEAFHRHKRPVWVSWRMDETYIKVKGQWDYLYRAVDKMGQTLISCCQNGATAGEPTAGASGWPRRESRCQDATV
jgi:hypothetical protein